MTINTGIQYPRGTGEGKVAERVTEWRRPHGLDGNIKERDGKWVQQMVTTDNRNSSGEERREREYR